MTEWSRFVSKASHSISHNPSLCPNHWCWRSWSWSVLWRPTRPSGTNTKKDVLFITGNWNAKVGSQETPVTGKFGLREQNEAGHRLTEFCQKTALVIANTFFQQHKRWLYTWTSPNDVAEDGEAVHSQQKQTCSWLWLRPSASQRKIQA